MQIDRHLGPNGKCRVLAKVRRGELVDGCLFDLAVRLKAFGVPINIRAVYHTIYPKRINFEPLHGAAKRWSEDIDMTEHFEWCGFL